MTGRYTQNIKCDFEAGKIFREKKNGEWNEVGSKNKKGYLHFMLNGKMIKCHRFIYEKFHNVKLQPHEQIDHISRIKDDNRIENLRVVNNQQNKQNSSVYKTNKLGLKHIHWDKIAQKYVVQIKINMRCIYFKRFKTLEEAIITRNNEIKRLNQLGHIFSC